MPTGFAGWDGTITTATTYSLSNTTTNTTTNTTLDTWTVWTSNAWTTWTGTFLATTSAAIEFHDDAPRQRAERLLKANLTLEQTAQLEAQGWFEVLGSLGRRYRIWQGQVRNVIRLGEDGTPAQRLCAHPAEYVPDEDAMLAQKLLIEVDEEAFAKIANVSAP